MINQPPVPLKNVFNVVFIIFFAIPHSLHGFQVAATLKKDLNRDSNNFRRLVHCNKWKRDGDYICPANESRIKQEFYSQLKQWKLWLK